MSKQQPIPVEIEAAKRRFPLGRFVLWSLGGLIVLGIGLFGLDQSQSSRKLKATLADLDESDPGWKLEEIELARDSIPDAENSAILCRELGRLLGGSWPAGTFDEKFANVTLPELLDAESLELLEGEMKRLEPIRLAARRLAGMPRGRHEIDFAFNPLMTTLDDQQRTRQVARLFRYEMLYLSNEGDVSGAVRSGRACVCAGRSLYDEPFLISQLIRIANVTTGLGGVEAALSLGESNEAELIALERLLADEGKDESLLLALRGERAMLFQLFSRLSSGAITAESMAKEMQMTQQPFLQRVALYPRWQVRRQQPVLMDLMNRVVENARLPLHEQIAGEARLDDELQSMRRSPSLATKFIAPTSKVADAHRRKTAQVAAMRGMIAGERFRMKHGKWPAKLGDVVPEFLKSVPLDPFNGTPLKMAKVVDGVIVYSVGADLVDNGGKLDREDPRTPGSDIGFQLWDTVKRRQSPSMKPKSEENP